MTPTERARAEVVTISPPPTAPEYYVMDGRAWGGKGFDEATLFCIEDTIEEARECVEDYGGISIWRVNTDGTVEWMEDVNP